MAIKKNKSFINEYSPHSVLQETFGPLRQLFGEINFSQWFSRKGKKKVSVIEDIATRKEEEYKYSVIFFISYQQFNFVSQLWNLPPMSF